MSRVLIVIALFGLAATSRHHPHDRIALGDVTVPEGEEVRSVVAIGGNATLLQGARAREVVALGGSVDLAEGAQVERDATAIGGDLTVGAGARVGRNAATYGGAIEVDEGGSVAGTISPHPDFGGGGDEEYEVKVSPAWGIAWRLLGGVFEFLSLFCFGALLLLVAPRQLDGIIGAFSHEPWVSGLTGLLGSLLLPPMLLMLIVTLIGIPFIPVLLVAVFLAGAAGYAALALFIGRLIPVPIGDYGRLALGVIVVTAVTILPFLGAVAWSVGWFLAFGAALRSRLGTRATEPHVGGGTAPPAAAIA